MNYYLLDRYFSILFIPFFFKFTHLNSVQLVVLQQHGFMLIITFLEEFDYTSSPFSMRIESFNTIFFSWAHYQIW